MNTPPPSPPPSASPSASPSAPTADPTSVPTPSTERESAATCARAGDHRPLSPRPAESLAILIPTHNRSELLGRTLASLMEVDRPAGLALEVVVVANNCQDDTVAVAERGLAALREAWGGGADAEAKAWVVEEFEPGLNPARTRGVRESRGELCVFLDDDVRLSRGWLTGMLAGFDEHGADLVGGRVTLWWDVVQRPDWLPDRALGLLSDNDRGPEPRWLEGSLGVIGANFGFRRRVFDAIGGFTPGLDRVGKSLLGFGESEFIHRAQAAGFRALYLPEAWLEHWVAPERLTRAYLTGVAYGGGISRVKMKPAFPPRVVLRTLAGNGWLALRHGLGMAGARLRGDRRSEIGHACRAAAGRGGLAGTWKRLVG